MHRSPAALLAELTPMIVTLLLAVAPRAAAQAAPGAPVTETTIAERHDVINEKEHHYIGNVEMERGDAKLYADDVLYYADQDRAVATGNVVFRQGSNQISADRADFNTNTRLGTFYNASGFATVQPPRQTPRPGAIALPPVVGQETIVYFFGKTVEKIGPRKYKIEGGGFTTCVQPTPRWDLHADTIVLNVDHYTLLRQAVMTVKGVPMFYLPILYYPTKKEDRATGFLLPTYGRSTLRGQSIHNAFFWAIDRSQDATFLHDWFSKTGQGVGSEYRYNFGGGSDGNIRAYFLDQHAATYANSDGTVSPLDATRSYEVHGSASQLLPGRLRARGSVDYFSSFVTNQTFNTNIADTSLSTRHFGGNVVGAWGRYSLNGTFDHTEYFYSPTSESTGGSWPRLDLTRNERPIGSTPLYFSATGEYANLLSDRKDDVLGEVNQGLQRLDFLPQIRFPFKKWQWFTVNSTANWRETYYSRSLADASPTSAGVLTNANLNRNFFTLQAQITGPVFNRIFDTPGNGYAEKFKHSIEPYVNIQRTSPIDNYFAIVKNEGVDYVVGGVTQITYGLTNRFYAKRKAAPGQAAQAREIVDVDVTQTYYSDQLAAQVDPNYSTSFNCSTSTTGATSCPNTSKFSPYAVSVRAMPTNQINGTVRAEFDSQYHALRQISASGTYAWSSQVQSTVSWSKRGFIPTLTGFNDPAFLDHTVNVTSNVRTKDNKYGTIYSFNYDVLHSTMIQQQLSGFYNAQCCGIAFEYQNYHYVSGSNLPITSDHRFFMSFTLSGLGNFSPFNGALSGVPR